MTILFTADLHASANPRDQYRLDWMEKRLPEIIEEHRVTTLIVGGDLTEEKDRHGSWLVNWMAAWAVSMTTFCDELIIYKGNHDYVAADDPFFMFLGLLPRVRFYSEPQSLDVEGHRCLFLPHTRDHVRDWEGLLDIRHELIFAHNAFTGADMGNGRKVEGIPTTIFDTLDLVLAGDIHIPQTLGPVRYVGAPYTIDFGDNYEPRVLIIDRDRHGLRKIKSVRCSGPQKLLIDIRHVAELDSIETMKGDVAKIRIHLKNYETEAYSRMVNDVRAWAASRSVLLHAIQPIAETSDGRRVPLPTWNFVHRRDDKSTLDAYGKSRDIDKRTMTTGHFLMDRTK